MAIRGAPNPKADYRSRVPNVLQRRFLPIGCGRYRRGRARYQANALLPLRSKDSLLAAVLANQNDLALARIRRWTEKARGKPAEIVAILFAELEAWAKQPGWTGTGFTRVAMELADMPGHPARLAASRHKAAVEQWLIAQFAVKQVHKPAVLARKVVLLIEGCQLLALIHGDVSYIKAAGETARYLIKHQHSE